MAHSMSTPWGNLFSGAARGIVSNVCRINFALPPSEASALRNLAAGRGVTVAAALRQAIATELFMEEARQRGERIQAVGPDGARELVFLR